MSSNNIENAIEKVDTVYGRIAFFRNDLYLGRSLREYGEWAQKELDFLRSLIEDGSVVVDAGAFIGTHTMAFSSFVGPKGHVYSFEPHPTSFQILELNTDSNKLMNVEIINAALSDKSGKMSIEEHDLLTPNSMGSLQLGEIDSKPNMVTVKTTTLDELGLDACHLIKVDVEGMESLVLYGGRSTIDRHQPYVYAECNSADDGWPVVLMMRSHGYTVYIYSEEAYNSKNFRKNKLNIFGSARELSLVCVPPHLDDLFRRRLSPSLDVIPIDRLDDLVLCLIKKPQYKQEVLANSNGARQWGNDFWKNEGELNRIAERDGQIANLNQAVTVGDEQLTNLNQAAVERRAAYQSHIIELETAVDLQQQRNFLLTSEASKLLRVITERDGQNTSLNLAVAELNRQIASINQEATERQLSYQCHVSELETAVWAKQQHYFLLTAESARLRIQLDSTLESRLWKSTAPLRQFPTFMHKVPATLFLKLISIYRTLPIAPIQRQNLKNFVFSKFGFVFVRMGAYQRWKEYRNIQTVWPTVESVVETAPAIPMVPGTIATLSSADGTWEWRDYNAVKLRISQIKAQHLSQVSPSPWNLIDIGNESLASAAARVKLPAPIAAPDISIILPVFNNLQLTLECLLSIVGYSDPDISYEIIVADDASTDETAQIIGSIPHLRVIRNDSNLGFLRNCNNALKHVQGNYVLYLNNDVQVTSGWLSALLRTFDTHPKVGAVGPRFVYPSGHLQEAGAAFRPDGTADMVGLNGDSTQARFSYTRRVDYVSGACLMLPTPLAKQLNGFSEEFLPCYCEDSDLCLSVQQAGYYVYYNPAATIVHHLSKTTASINNSFKMSCIAKNLVTLQNKWQHRLEKSITPKVIAFYLPQFHPIPENNKWWGNGFTEWANVTKAQANFVGHYQPRNPADLGYYDLRLSEVMEQQAELARRYGVGGFCFYYYWFDGKRLLDRPIEQMLETGKPDFPFCLCWANENWTRRWDGMDHEILMSQSHSQEDDRKVILDLIRFFRDQRYIRVDDRPLILVYRITLFPNFAETATLWRNICREQGIGEIYIAMVESMEMVHADKQPKEYGCDAAVEFPPQGLAVQKQPSGDLINPDFAGSVADYRDLAVRYATREAPAYTRFRGVIPGWDNTARRQNNSFCFEHATPGAFQAWLEETIEQTRVQQYGDERLIFVNAWNEWAEGAYLEPDRRFGHTYLEAVRNALDAASLLRKSDHAFGDNEE